MAKVLKTGQKKKIKAKRIMPKKGRMREHVDRFRYEVTDKKIATVTKKGVVRGKKAGFKGAPGALFCYKYFLYPTKDKTNFTKYRGRSTL